MKNKLFLILLLFVFFIPSVLPLSVDIPIPLNYSNIVINETSNDSILWNGNTWSDTRWLNIDGSNANQNINIGNYNLTTTGWFKGDLNWSDVQNAPTSSWLSTYNSTYDAKPDVDRFYNWTDGAGATNDLTTTGTGTFGEGIIDAGSESESKLRVGQDANNMIGFNHYFSEMIGDYNGKMSFITCGTERGYWLFDNVDTGNTIQNNAMSGKYVWQASGTEKMSLSSTGYLTTVGTVKGEHLYSTDDIWALDDIGAGGQIKADEDVTVGYDADIQSHLNLIGKSEVTSSQRGGSIEWWYMGYDVGGYTYMNTNKQIVFDTTAQASYTDTGNAWIDVDDGSASFSDVTADKFKYKTIKWKTEQLESYSATGRNYGTGYMCNFTTTGTGYTVSYGFIPENAIEGGTIQIMGKFIAKGGTNSYAVGGNQIRWNPRTVITNDTLFGAWNSPTYYINLTADLPVNGVTEVNVKNITANAGDYFTILLYRYGASAGDTYAHDVIGGTPLYIKYQVEEA